MARKLTKPTGKPVNVYGPTGLHARIPRPTSLRVAGAEGTRGITAHTRRRGQEQRKRKNEQMTECAVCGADMLARRHGKDRSTCSMTCGGVQAQQTRKQAQEG